MVRFVADTYGGNVQDLTYRDAVDINIDENKEVYTNRAVPLIANNVYTFSVSRPLRPLVNDNFKFSKCDKQYSFKWIANAADSKWKVGAG